MTEAVKRVLEDSPPTPSKPAFRFEMAREAAYHNLEVLKGFGMSLGAAIAAQASSPLGCGSEFRSPEVLEPLLGRHPLWSRMRSILSFGSIWALDPVSDADRVDSLLANLKRGNHKSATERPDTLRALLLDDVVHGFSLPIPKECIPDLPGAEAAPMGLTAQHTISETGEIIPKDRLTHDQTFQAGAGASVNDRCRMAEHQECVFGFALRRCVAYVVDTRRRHPGVRILGNKVDLKSAYRRAHLSPEMALKSITTFGDLGLVALRLTFGGRPCPSEFCNISEVIADLASALLASPSWDPRALHSPNQRLVPTATVLPDAVPFEPALPMVVDLPPRDYGVTDAYIDDIPTLVPDLGDNRARGAAAVLLAIHAVARPLAADEPIPRDDLASIKKLLAEGGLAETMTLLGWTLDLRRLRVALPDDKFMAWTATIDSILAVGVATKEELETLVGRLNHVGFVVPAARHFLSRIRDAQHKARGRRKPTALSTVALADLHIWKKFLARAHAGVNMNLLTPRIPTHEFLSDACEHGLGGMSLGGRAWRIALEPSQQGRFTLNTLEFMAAVIGPWIDLIEGRLPPLSCILACTDSTTGAGWLHRSNFRERGWHDGKATMETAADVEVKVAVARTYATVLLDAEAMLYPQWFAGKLNVETDCLSRDTHLTDAEIVDLLRSSPSCHLPQDFCLRPVPSVISSWVASLAQKLPVRKALRSPLPRSELWLGRAGRASSDPSASNKTPTSPPSPAPATATCSSAPSPTRSAVPTIRRPSTAAWLRRQSEIPLMTYVRPSGLDNARTLVGMRPAEPPSFFSVSSEATPTTTRGRDTRRQSPAPSCER